MDIATAAPTTSKAEKTEKRLELLKLRILEKDPSGLKLRPLKKGCCQLKGEERHKDTTLDSATEQ